MNNSSSRTRLWWLIPLVLGAVYIVYRNQHNSPAEHSAFHTNSGRIFGTFYTAIYRSDRDLQADITAELQRFDLSLSTFNPHSIITKVNQNQDVVVDTLFSNVFRRAKEISEQTGGAFDFTVAPLVNVWGFGFKNETFPDSATVDSLKSLVNYRAVTLGADGRVTKSDPRIMLDCSAVAKGYASDVIANLLTRRGINDYMVEIGGEVVVKGHNQDGQKWRIGINKPVEDSLAVNQELQLILQLTDKGLATSGNYRNFYYKGGKMYAHTIDPSTGYPVLHSLLSATVIADDCMTADALATAFMVMGLEKSKAYTESHPQVGACFIYADDEGRYQTYITPNIRSAVVNRH